MTQLQIYQLSIGTRVIGVPYKNTTIEVLKGAMSRETTVKISLPMQCKEREKKVKMVETVPLIIILDEEAPTDIAKQVNYLLAELKENCKRKGWTYTIKDNLVPNK